MSESLDSNKSPENLPPDPEQPSTSRAPAPQPHETQRTDPVFLSTKPFPEEGILGMYPIPSACKKRVAEHMIAFQQKLTDEYVLKRIPNVNAEITDFKQSKPLSETLLRAAEQMCTFEEEIDELKHMLQVAAIKRKYGGHDPGCPYYDENS